MQVSLLELAGPHQLDMAPEKWTTVVRVWTRLALEVGVSRSYPNELRQSLCERMLAGERVGDIAVTSGICEGTLFRWRAQAKIEANLRDGAKSCEAAELAKAHKRIRELEDELQLTKDACALFDRELTLSPKGNTRS